MARVLDKLAIAASLVALTFLIGCVLSQSGLAIVFDKLFRWDAVWYESISSRGFQYSVNQVIRHSHSNAAFFPGFPLSVRLVQQVTRLDPRHATVVASALAAWGFWFFILRMLQRWNASRLLQVTAIISIFCYPSSFYLIAGYAESLFLVSILAFWFFVAEKPSFVFASVSGIILTSTRLVGVPLAVLPFLQALIESHVGPMLLHQVRYRRLIWRGLLISAVSLIGILMFFAFCHYRFERWDLYFLLQKLGWGHFADYLAPFRLQTYRAGWPGLVTQSGIEVHDVWVVYRLSAAHCLGALLFLLGCEGWAFWKYKFTALHTRWGLYFAAAVTLYLPIAAVYHEGMRAMQRYTIVPHTLLIIAAVHLVSRPRVRGTLLEKLIIAALILSALATAPIFWTHFRGFLGGVWIA